jgi:phage terminase Nu1 subunit (DNA packaging protein)
MEKDVRPRTKNGYLRRQPGPVKKVAGFSSAATREVVAHFCDCGIKQIDALVDAGVMKKPLILGPCIVAYIRHEREQSGTLTAQRSRLTKSKADAAEMLAKKLAGSLLPQEQVQSVWDAIIANIRTRVIALPSRLAALWGTIRSPQDAERILRGLVNELLDEVNTTDMVIAKDDAEAEVEEDDDQIAEGDAPDVPVDVAKVQSPIDPTA